MMMFQDHIENLYVFFIAPSESEHSLLARMLESIAKFYDILDFGNRISVALMSRF